MENKREITIDFTYINEFGEKHRIYYNGEPNAEADEDGLYSLIDKFNVLLELSGYCTKVEEK